MSEFTLMLVGEGELVCDMLFQKISNFSFLGSLLWPWLTLFDSSSLSRQLTERSLERVFFLESEPFVLTASVIG